MYQASSTRYQSMQYHRTCADGSDQPVVLQRVCDSILQDRCGLVAAIRQDRFGADTHRNAVGHSLQHRNIVFRVPNGITVVLGDSQFFL